MFQWLHLLFLPCFHCPCTKSRPSPASLWDIGPMTVVMMDTVPQFGRISHRSFWCRCFCRCGLYINHIFSLLWFWEQTFMAMSPPWCQLGQCNSWCQLGQCNSWRHCPILWHAAITQKKKHHFHQLQIRYLFVSLQDLQNSCSLLNYWIYTRVQSSYFVTCAFTYRVNIRLLDWSISVLNNGLQIRQLVPNFANFLKLMIVFDDYNVAVGVVGDVLASVGQVCGIYSSCETTKNIRTLLQHKREPKHLCINLVTN